MSLIVTHPSGECRDINYLVYCDCCGVRVANIHERSYLNRNKRFQAKVGYRDHYFRKFEDCLLWIKQEIDAKANKLQSLEALPQEVRKVVEDE